MIMNYQIPVKEKKRERERERENATISFSRGSAVWPVGSKAKIIPLHAWTDPFGSRRLRSQDF
jgi:hypothetical protein